MSHPHNEHRAHKHAKARLSHIAGVHQEPKMHRASGGKVLANPAPTAKATLRADGGAVKPRADKATRRAKGGAIKRAEGGSTTPKRESEDAARETRELLERRGLVTPSRARGGHVKKHSGKTNVNVIVAPHGAGEGGPPAAPPMPPVGAAPPMPPKPPMPPMPPPGGPPGGPPMGGPPGLPPGMPPRNVGGRAYKHGGKIDCSQGKTPVQHSGNKSDTQNIGRGPVITRKTGGPIYADGREGKEMGPKLHAGAASGVGRREKNKLAHSGHWEK